MPPTPPARGTGRGQQTTTTTVRAEPAPHRPGEKRGPLGLSRSSMTGAGAVGVGAIAFFLWRARKNAAASAAAAGTPTTTGTCPDGSTPDGNGNCPQNSQDFSGQLDTLQAEIAALQGALGGAGGGGGGGTTGTPTPTPPPGSPPPSGPTSPSWAFPAPGALTAYNQSATGYRLRWTAVHGPNGQVPTGYTVATYNSRGQLVDQFTTTGTSTAEYGRGGRGLPAGQYHTNVWANGGSRAPAHATVSVTLTK